MITYQTHLEKIKDLAMATSNGNPKPDPKLEEKAPGLQIAQILADLNDLNVAPRDAALALVTANKNLEEKTSQPNPSTSSATYASISRQDSLASAVSNDGNVKSTNEVDPDLDRAKTLPHLQDIKRRITQHENGGLARVRADVSTIYEKYKRLQASNT